MPPWLRGRPSPGEFLGVPGNSNPEPDSPEPDSGGDSTAQSIKTKHKTYLFFVKRTFGSIAKAALLAIILSFTLLFIIILFEHFYGVGIQQQLNGQCLWGYIYNNLKLLTYTFPKAKFSSLILGSFAKRFYIIDLLLSQEFYILDLFSQGFSILASCIRVFIVAVKTILCSFLT